MKKNEKEYYLYKSVQDDNILPLTSKCNLSCIFCSHKQNPKDVEIIRLGDLSLDKIYDLIDYLNPKQPIIIGESATKIIEGEPLVHPNFIEIIKSIREKNNETEIKITTNGNLLDENLINFFEKIKNITLNISVNYLDFGLRKKVMGNNCKRSLNKALQKLKYSNIEYNFSTVALPHLFGYRKIKEEIIKMCDYNPLTIRVFMPGYTALTSDDLKFNYKEVYQNLYEMVKEFNLTQKIPLILEPPQIKNLKSEVKGIIKGSPADEANIKYLDIIKRVNNKAPVSRVEAFNTIKSLKNPILEIKREDKLIKTAIKKEKEQRSGLIMDYDLPLTKINEVDKVIEDNQNKKILFLTSKLGYNLINYILKKHLGYDEQENIFIEEVKNTYLKGSIISTGLLTNLDIENHIENQTDIKPDLLILPAVMYDIFNNDLRGDNYQSLESEHLFEIEIL